MKTGENMRKIFKEVSTLITTPIKEKTESPIKRSLK